jgi:hypothetical protein
VILKPGASSSGGGSILPDLSRNWPHLAMTEMTDWISIKNPPHASLIDNLRTPPYLSLIVPILPDEFTLQLLKATAQKVPHFCAAADWTDRPSGGKRDSCGERKD